MRRPIFIFGGESLKRYIEVLKVSKNRETTPELASAYLSSLEHYYYIKVRIHFNPARQSISTHPLLTGWLEEDWGHRLSLLECSTGDFRRALKFGEVSMGHVVAEIFVLSFDWVSIHLGHGLLRLDERFMVSRVNESYSDYYIRIFTNKEYPKILIGIEKIVVNYLNAILNNRQYSIHPKLEKFIVYQQTTLGMRLGRYLNEFSSILKRIF